MVDYGVRAGEYSVVRQNGWVPFISGVMNEQKLPADYVVRGGNRVIVSRLSDELTGVVSLLEIVIPENTRPNIDTAPVFLCKIIHEGGKGVYSQKPLQIYANGSCAGSLQEAVKDLYEAHARETRIGID